MDDTTLIQLLLGEVSWLGFRPLNQAKEGPVGFAQVVILVENYIGHDGVSLIFDENNLYGFFEINVKKAVKEHHGGVVFAQTV